MKLAELSPQTIDRIKAYRWDRIIEKHEGPENWSSVLKYHDPDFIIINQYNVLLPISKEQHSNITILRCVVADNGKMLTIFLKDTTFVENPKEEQFYAGFVAICEEIPGEDFFIATLYHEWFIIDNA
jgi:hypothetical protein